MAEWSPLFDRLLEWAARLECWEQDEASTLALPLAESIRLAGSSAQRQSILKENLVVL